MATGVFVSYLRVSTGRQGKSGLGLDAQREAVAAFLNGGDWRLAAEVVEIESGKRSDRPKLAEALRLCRLHHATLVIAKLDRLARNVAFVSGLMESGVDFVACDFPQANRLTVHILAAVAEHEARAISERTKAALAQAKRRGKQLGGWRGGSISAETRAKGQAAIRARIGARSADLGPVLAEIRAGGATTLRAIAAELTARGIPTARGGEHWSPAQVSRALAQAA